MLCKEMNVKIEKLLKDHFKKPLMHDKLLPKLKKELSVCGFYNLPTFEREQIFYKIKYEN